MSFATCSERATRLPPPRRVRGAATPRPAHLLRPRAWTQRRPGRSRRPPAPEARSRAYLPARASEGHLGPRFEIAFKAEHLYSLSHLGGAPDPESGGGAGRARGTVPAGRTRGSRGATPSPPGGLCPPGPALRWGRGNSEGRLLRTSPLIHASRQIPRRPRAPQPSGPTLQPGTAAGEKRWPPAAAAVRAPAIDAAALLQTPGRRARARHRRCGAPPGAPPACACLPLTPRCSSWRPAGVRVPARNSASERGNVPR